MTRVYAINGSPRMGKGKTAELLEPFLVGMKEAGAEVNLAYASTLDIKPCSCGDIYCWNREPGVCCVKDGFQEEYPKIKGADILLLATPVYIPLPGKFQDFLNRLCPLLNPDLRMIEGRTRAVFRKDVKIKKITLMVTSGWWEKENCDTAVRIGQELAKDASVEFVGPMIRPHINCMKSRGEFTPGGEAVMKAVRQAGVDLIKTGAISANLLEEISRPLLTLEQFTKFQKR